MAIAPSEKHLEQWIIANPEYFGDAFDKDECGIPDYALERMTPIGNGYYVDPFYEKLIARQLRFPTGIPDIIAQGSRSVCAIEIKKGALNYETIAQCLRYMHDLQEIFNAVYMDVVSLLNPDHHLYRYDPSRHIDISGYPETEVTGMLVGHTVNDPNLAVICAISNIVVITYDYDPDSDFYEFTRCEYSSPATFETYKEYANGAIGVAFKEIIQRRKRDQDFYNAHMSKEDSE